jgi:hypothetical protein
MVTKISASAASFTDDGDCTVLGFANEPNNPTQYVVLQFANAPDEEELSYGWGGVHIDTGALGIEGYDLVQRISETATGVLISLVPDIAQTAGVEHDIEVALQRDRAEGASLSEAIRRFDERLLSWKAAQAG